jgi:hypothetical protein
MKTRKITESQLREMIKESLEESIVEIGEDDERSKLSRLGSKRTPEQTKRYKQLLESKLRRLHEEVGQQQVLPGFGSATAEEGAMLKGGGAKEPKLGTALAKKFGRALDTNSKLQALLDGAKNPKEIVEMIIVMLQEVLEDQQNAPEAEKIEMKDVVTLFRAKLPQLLQLEKSLQST